MNKKINKKKLNHIQKEQLKKYMKEKKQTLLQKRMENVFKEHKYSWDFVDTIVNVNFEMLCEFVENGDMHIIDWSYRKKVKKTIDEIYLYWKEKRPTLIKLSEEYCSIAYSDENFKHEFVPTNNPELVMWNSEQNKTGKKFSKLHRNLDKLVEKLDEKYLIELIKIRGYLWT